MNREIDIFCASVKIASNKEGTRFHQLSVKPARETVAEKR
jgi:hypothetical protein